MRRAVRPRTSARTSPGYSARTPSHASIRLEKSVHRLSIGKLEPNIARPEPKLSSTTLVTSAISSASTAVHERALAGELDADVRAPAELHQRVAPRLARDRHAGVDEHEREVRVRLDELQRRRELVREDLQLEDEPERGQLAPGWSLNVSSWPRSGAVAKRKASCSCQCSCSRTPRSSGVACELGLNRSRAASGAKRSAEPTIACGQPVRSCWACTHSTSLTRVLQAPVGLHVDRLAEALGLGVGLVVVDRVGLALQRLVGAEDARDHRPVEPREPFGGPDVVVRVDEVSQSFHLVQEGGEVARAGQVVEIVDWIAAIARVTGRYVGSVASGVHHSSR